MLHEFINYKAWVFAQDYRGDYVELYQDFLAYYFQTLKNN